MTQNQISSLPLSTRFSSSNPRQHRDVPSHVVLRSRKRRHLRQLAAPLLLVFRPVSLEMVRESGRASKSWPRYDSNNPGTQTTNTSNYLELLTRQSARLGLRILPFPASYFKKGIIVARARVKFSDMEFIDHG